MANKKGNLGKKIAIGAGVVAAGTAAYMLLGPDGKKNRAKVKKVVEKAKAKGKAMVNVAKKKVASVKKTVKKVAKQVAVAKQAVKKEVKK
jgi:uncharacterized protein (UPF0333 family)